MAKFKGVERPCLVCGKLFKSPQCQAHVKSCSNECGNKLRGASNKGIWVALKCASCGNDFLERECHASRRRFCSKTCFHSDEAHKAEKSQSRMGELNAAWKGGKTRKVISESGKSYSRTPAIDERIKAATRRAAKLQATPKWASEALILAIYEECQLQSEETGVPHHVDHVVPLISDIVCGLHCEANLQILPALDNLSKGNRHWPYMP